MSSSTFAQYARLSEETEGIDGFDAGLALDRTRSLLNSTLNDSPCLVCLERVSAEEAVWQCGGCYCLLHMECTQQWARSCYQEDDERTHEKHGGWQCPKCRRAYDREETPVEYRCWCGKESNPQHDGWTAPHSCGLQCEKELSPPCGHRCTLLCHPGPCLPCPVVVRDNCPCGGESQVRRCSQESKSCGKVCGRLLLCAVHHCRSQCHKGECPPCGEMSEQSCQCGASSEQRPCSSGIFRCTKQCSLPLSCGHHNCEVVCHSGPCPPCALDGPRRCHCGSELFQELRCTDKEPSCGGTCGKPLDCGSHSCPDRCHNGPCPPCRVPVTKNCRCGRGKRSVLCSQDFLCDRKCSATRSCGRHQCKKKCCTGEDCPPCHETCGKRLGCRNHKCEATCHRGKCFPCAVVVEIPCYCGKEVLPVPCGTERHTAPPRCSANCIVPPTCHHPSRTAHHCHFEDCPPCRQVCDVALPTCGHRCGEPCHDPIPPPPPPSRKKKKKRVYPPPVAVEDVTCPPCPVKLKRQCWGLHESAELSCHSQRLFSCQGKCGNPLSCGNHNCAMPCHPVGIPKDSRALVLDENETPARDGSFESRSLTLPAPHGRRTELSHPGDLTRLLKRFEGSDTCQQCELPCQVPRPEGCTHKCILPCHPGDCPPCEKKVRKYCHCPLKTRYDMKCIETLIPKGELDAILCCGAKCTRTLECGHICGNQCHAGVCRDPRECTKAVKLSCACGRVSIKLQCKEKVSAKAPECDSTCEEEKQKRMEEIRRERDAKREKEKMELERALQEKRKRKKKGGGNSSASLRVAGAFVPLKKDRTLVDRAWRAVKRRVPTTQLKIALIYLSPFLFLALIAFAYSR